MFAIPESKMVTQPNSPSAFMSLLNAMNPLLISMSNLLFKDLNKVATSS